MQCPYCQAPLVAGASFCVQCGRSLTQIPASSNPQLAGGNTAASQPGMPMMPTDPASAPPSVPPMYAPPPSQPLYPAAPSQPYYTNPPAPSGYGAVPAPSQPMYGAFPPSQPFYSPAPSQPLYPNASAPNLYAAPATVPFTSQPQGQSLFVTIFGPAFMPAAAQPYSRIQRTLMRSISPAAVVNVWMTAIIGALVALVSGLILTAAAGSLWSKAISAAFSSSLAGTGTISSLTQFVQPFLTPDLWKLFALAHHVPLDISATTGLSGSSAGASLSLGIPLTGLLLAPALALTLGGYVAAASDFTRQARYSIARGALLGPFYGVLLAITALLGSSHVSNVDVVGGTTVTVAPSVGFAFLYGLIWGVLFGALGGWIHVSGRYWLSTALATLQTVRNGRLAGALAGAVAALVVGILLYSAAYIGLTAFNSLSGAAQSPGTPPALDVVSTLTVNLLFAPVVAVYAFALGTGAPISYYTSSTSGQGDFSISVSLLNGYQASGLRAGAASAAAPHFPPSPVYYLLVLGALISYLVGGRIAARVARARGAGDGFVAGTLMAVPLALIMTGVALLASFTVSVAVSGPDAGTGGTAGFAPTFGGMFLAVLIAGAVCGGIGGASAVSVPRLSALLRVPLILFWPVGKLLSPLLDVLTGRNRQQRRSDAMRWIYDGVAAAVTLIIVAVALDILNSASPKILPFAALWRVEGAVAALLVGVPLACFLAALVTAFTTPMPLAPAPSQPAFATPFSVPAYATIPPGMPGVFDPSTLPPQYPPMPSQPASFPPTPGFGAPGSQAPSQPPF